MIHLTINIRHDIDIHVSGESAYNKRKTGTEREERERGRARLRSVCNDMRKLNWKSTK